MIGIFSALSLPDVYAVFVVACDMPFVNVILLQYIAKKYVNTYDAVVPVFHKQTQPLLSIYSKSILNKMKEKIQQRTKSMKEFLKEINVLYISEEEVKNLDPKGRSFVNINTMEDFHREIGGELCLV
jgi:molybdopterin-guanine dinucleotide biosynthesis protein A